MTAAFPPVAHPLSPELRLMTTRDLVWLIGSLLIVTAPHAKIGRAHV